MGTGIKYQSFDHYSNSLLAQRCIILVLHIEILNINLFTCHHQEIYG